MRNQQGIDYPKRGKIPVLKCEKSKFSLYCYYVKTIMLVNHFFKFQG